jgi:outer membrane protein
MHGKRLGWVIGIILIAGWVGSGWGSDLKIACVDFGKVMNECQAGKDAMKAFSKEQEKLQRQNGEKQKELQTMKESLEKQTAMLTSEARASKEKEYQTKVREYQRWMEDNDKEIRQKAAELERTVGMGLQKVIKKLGEEEGYTLILMKNENFVLFASKAIDITDRVIKAYDAQKK